MQRPSRANRVHFDCTTRFIDIPSRFSPSPVSLVMENDFAFIAIGYSILKSAFLSNSARSFAENRA